MLIFYLPLSCFLCSETLGAQGSSAADRSESHQDLRLVLSCPSPKHNPSEEHFPDLWSLIHALLPLPPSPALNSCPFPALPALHSQCLPFVPLEKGPLTFRVSTSCCTLQIQSKV